jgi:hypothetical protein
VSLYRPAPLLTAMDALLTAVLLATVGGKPLTVETDAATWTAPQVILEQTSGPTMTAIAMGGPSWAVLGVQVTCVATTRTQARLMGDLVREALAGVDRHGLPLHPLTPAGFTVDTLTSGNDGRIAQDNPPTWTETFELRYQ